MRTARHTPLCLLFVSAALLGACRSADTLIEKDPSVSKPFDDEFQVVVQRAEDVLRKHFRYIDPDKTVRDEGNLYSLWRVHRSISYRNTRRERGRVSITRDPKGKLMVQVAVVRQINDNIENPDAIDEARWVDTARAPNIEMIILAQITRPYRGEFKVSEYYKARNKDPKDKRLRLREDLLDPSKDVDLTEYDERKEPERATGKKKFGAEKEGG